MCPQNTVKLCECGCGLSVRRSKRFVYGHWRPQPGDLLKRFWSKIDKRGDEECWLWTGTVVARYGQFWVAGEGGEGGKRVKAHRLAYELVVGPIPKGLVIDHLCKKPLCCNPRHMEPVTNVENVMRGNSNHAVNARKTHCKNGHEFTPENTGPRANGGRACRVCARERTRDYRERTSVGSPVSVRSTG